MRKHKGKIRAIGGKKAVRAITAVTMLVLLTGAALAALTSDKTCSNHREHDETCGYIEAKESRPCTHGHTEECYVDEELDCKHEHDTVCEYAEEQQGHACDHTCPLCDPADKIEKQRRTFDKNEESKFNLDVEIMYQKNSDVMSGVSLVTAEKDEQGDPILSSLKPEEQYQVEEDKVILKKEYLDTLTETDQNFELEFEGGNQQVLIEIEDSTPKADVDIEGKEEHKEEESKSNTPVESTDKETGDGSEKSAPLTKENNLISDYDIKLEATTIAEDVQHINILKQQDSGLLKISVNLPSGKAGRYIDIKPPAYGFKWGDTPIQQDGRITKVERLGADADQFWRLHIADSVNETINLEVEYIYRGIQYGGVSVSTINKWGEDGTLPTTGFQVIVANSEGTLAEKQYGQWSPTNPEGSAFNEANWRVQTISSISGLSTRGNSYFEIPILGLRGNNSLITNGDYAREDIREIKVFVPDPSIVKSSAPSLWENSQIKNDAFSISDIQTNGDKWWYSFVIKDGYSVDSLWRRYGDELNVKINFSLNEIGTPIPPEGMSVSAELTIRRYGNDDIKTIRGEGILQMAPQVRRDEFSSRMWPGSGTVEKILVNEEAETKVVLMNGDTRGIDLDTDYFTTHKATNTVQTFRFPYEIQPYQIKCTLYGKSTLRSIKYKTSDGESFDVSIESGVWQAMDEIPEGERVTEVEVIYDQLYNANGYPDKYHPYASDLTINSRVPQFYKDGTSIQDGTRVQVGHTASTPDSTNVITSGTDNLLYEIKSRSCPIIFATSNGATQLMDNKIARSGLRIGIYSQGGTEVREVLNPKFRVKIEDDIKNSSISSDEMMGYYFTGKFKAMPIMSGWQVKYHTKNKGLQSFDLPTNIPAGGSTVQLPIEEGDRFVGMWVFEKEGIVRGLDGSQHNILNDFEVQPARMTDDGRNIGLDQEQTIEGQIKVYYSYGNCGDGEHVGEDAFSTENTGVGSFVGDLRLVHFSEVMWKKGRDAYHNFGSIYQGEEKGITRDLPISPSVKNVPENFSLYFQEPIVVYQEILNPELIYTGGKFTMYINGWGGGKGVAEYLETDNGKVWLKMTYPDRDFEWKSSSTKNVSVRWKMQALPGATLGSRPGFGDAYLDIGVEEWHNRYDGSENAGYVRYKPGEDLVADENGLLGDGDITTKRLYKYSLPEGEKDLTVLQKIFSGVTISPGKNQTYSIETKSVEMTSNDAKDLNGLVSVGAANENLKDYEVIISLPRKGKALQGKNPTGGAEETVTSEFTLRLKKELNVISNSTSSAFDHVYRLEDTTEWLTSDKVTDWGKVDSIKINIPILEANTVLNLNMDLETDVKADFDPINAFIGGKFSFESQSGIKSSGLLTYGTYTYQSFELKGTVWYDKNENGIMDGTEEKANAIPIHLKRVSDDTLIESQMTGANGNYEFKTNEGEGLYVEMALPEGCKLTRQSTNANASNSGTDSDFDRESNRYIFPPVLTNSTYQNLGAGMVRLPMLSVSDITVAKGKSLKGNAVATSDRGGLVLNYEPSADESIASVIAGTATTNVTQAGSPGWVTGHELGTTTAEVWVENSLSDRVTAQYQIQVVPDIVDFTLGKNLAATSNEEETFVFMMECMDENGITKETFYQTITIPAGSLSGSMAVKGVTPGNYRITELDSNWRYRAAASNTKTVDMTNSEQSYRVDFTNLKETDAWVSGKDEVTNSMQEVTP